MIPLQTVFDQLKYGELYGVSLGGPDCSGISVQDYPMIVANINMALTELYKRFPLKTNELKIDLFDEITDYIIDSEYAQSNTASTAPQKWIDDSAEKTYEDDLLKIETVYNEIEEEFYLNNENKDFSLWIPKYNTVRHLMPTAGNSIFVHYKCVPEYLPTIDIEPDELTVPIPYSLLEALLWYIGARVYTSLNPDGQLIESQMYTAKFEQACLKISDLGLVNDTLSTNMKLDRMGWL